MQGDDVESAARCPADRGLLVTSCEVEVVDGEVLKGVSDGIWMTDTGCSAFSGNAGGARVRVKLTCSNLHDTVTVVTDGIGERRINKWRYEDAGVELSCPDGTRALQCFCWSPWHECGEMMGYGYSPYSRTSCLGPVNAKHRLTMLCAHE